MSLQVIVPSLGESISEATVLKWFKNVGEAVEVDEPLVELETDKVTVEVPAPVSGVLIEILAVDGTEVAVGGPLGHLEEGSNLAKSSGSVPELKPEAAPTSVPFAAKLSPAVRKMVDDNKLDPAVIPATGKKGQLTKADVEAFIATNSVRASAPASRAPGATPSAGIVSVSDLPPRTEDSREEVVKMSRLRQRIAQRLKEAQNTAAILTTYNEVDMTTLIKLRSDYRDSFEKKHGVRLGFLSFFVKASILALQEFPAVNAEIYGDQIIYKNYYDIGVAVGTPQGLVVPVLRNAQAMTFAEIERTIAEFGRRARDGKLTVSEMTGGTFTISNGGVYGSLMSMPILNPPQSGIIGMHKIQKRPMVIGDEIMIRDMMYLALSYDHRIVDGREAVTFLVRLKECIEDPQRLLIDV
ncbi:MAG: 2-oxoglutarate dehydrogenase complex dihydrolipoyllysine-residue succinyltransferase [Pseudomonadota bacterium]|nr:2-oxoglutarate dehydrogenase complex dihydrolipoyllysine-residue succinyltransferase [Pseudomonadota bacterium]